MLGVQHRSPKYGEDLGPVWLSCEPCVLQTARTRQDREVLCESSDAIMGGNYSLIWRFRQLHVRDWEPLSQERFLPSSAVILKCVSWALGYFRVNRSERRRMSYEAWVIENEKEKKQKEDGYVHQTCLWSTTLN